MGPWLDSQIRMLFRRCSPAWVAWGWVALLFWMGGMSASLWWAHGIVPPQSDRLVTDSVTLLTIQVQAQLSQPLRTPSFESLNYRQWMTQAVVPGRVVASPLLVAHGQHLPLETELLTQTVAAFHWTPYRSDGPSFQPVSDP